MEAKSDTTLFISHHGTETAYLLLYVDDIVLTASSESLLRRIIASIQQEFAMKDLGALHHFLVHYITSSGSLLSLTLLDYSFTSGSTLLISWRELG